MNNIQDPNQIFNKKHNMKYYILPIILLLMACEPVVVMEDMEVMEYDCISYAQCKGDHEGRFCSFGIKFGDDVIFENLGVDVEGPGTTGRTVSYSFQTSGTYPSSGFGDFESRPFDEIGPFAKDKIREALEEWASHIDITFIETMDEENSDLKYICADIEDKAGIAWSRCTDDDCTDVEGFVFLKNDVISESSFYSLALHETGHALGLCHSNSLNIMSYNSSFYDYDGLQPGDIEGIISIYGPK
jgi:hypothetical protein